MAKVAPLAEGAYVKVRVSDGAQPTELWCVTAVEDDGCWLEDCRTMNLERRTFHELAAALKSGLFELVIPS